MPSIPNLNVADPVWRDVVRDVRFRRALSLAIDRREINQVIYYGLGLEGQNTVLPSSPLFVPELRNAWTDFDLQEANRLLDEIGLRLDDGIRQLPDGRQLEIIVETAGENPEETDILELIHDSWLEAGSQALPQAPAARGSAQPDLRRADRDGHVVRETRTACPWPT